MKSLAKFPLFSLTTELDHKFSLTELNDLHWANLFSIISVFLTKYMSHSIIFFVSNIFIMTGGTRDGVVICGITSYFSFSSGSNPSWKKCWDILHFVTLFSLGELLTRGRSVRPVLSPTISRGAHSLALALAQQGGKNHRFKYGPVLAPQPVSNNHHVKPGSNECDSVYSLTLGACTHDAGV